MEGDQRKGTSEDDGKVPQVIKSSELSREEKQKLLEKIRRREGTAPIKEEFINFEKFSQLHTDKSDNSKNGASNLEGTADEPPTKKQKKTGQNKSRPKPVRYLPSEKLCLNMAMDKVCPYGTNCKFNHDVAGMLEKKPSDIGPKCYNFDSFGHCQFGLMCRYGTSHISSELKNITDELRRIDQKALTSNHLSMDLKRELRKKKIKYPRSVEYLKTLPRDGKGKMKAMKENSASFSRPAVKGNDSTESTVDLSTLKQVDEPTFVSSTEERLQCIEGNMLDGGQDNIQEKTNITLEKPNLTKMISAPADSSRSVEQQGESLAQRGRNGLCDLKGGNDSLEGSQQILAKEKCDFIEGDGKKSTDLNLSNEIKEPDGGAVKVNPTMVFPKGASCGYNAAEQGCTVGSVTVDTVTSVKAVKSEIDVTMATDTDCVMGISPREKKQLDVKGKLLLAPLTTVGNLPFRRICKRFGADVTCGEMAMCTNLLMGQACEWALLRRHHTEDVFGVQLCGAFPDTMTKCAELLSTRLNIDFIDINVGCPIDLVYHKGAGTGLMNRMSKFEQIVRGMSSVLDIPLTVKMRMGVLQNKNVAHTIIPKVYDWGASVVMVHGRSREARYTRSADWEYLKTCAEIASPHQFVGNGDILSYEDVNEHFKHSGSDGLMVARGALVKPWIFTEIKEQRHWDISSNERLDILRDFSNYGLEHWGSDTLGVNKTRRFLLEWLSFLHRYIPIGLLEQLPVKINQRPPFFFGRNDLETLMASSKCEDWIKISEMLLGPVPDDFLFLPKHKANSYN